MPNNGVSGRSVATQTNLDDEAAPARSARRDVLLLQGAVAFFVLLKLVFALFVPPNGDEAYYWLWGGHLQWSYFDHSPMVGWTSAIARTLLGWTPAGLHLPAMVSFAVLAYALHRSARWLAPEDPQRYFWLALAIFCGSPLLNALTIFNYPDHLLICFSTITLLLMGQYLGGVLRGEGRARDLYLGAVFLGLAGLSKYSAVFIAAGLVVVLIATPKLRSQFRSPHLYLAGAVTLLMTLPVFLWNVEHRFASVQFHAVDRMTQQADFFAPWGPVQLVGYAILAFSPFLLVGFSRFLLGKIPDGPQKGYLLLARATALLSILFFIPLAGVAAISKQVAPHWLVLSFVPFLIVAPLYVRSRLLIGLHLGWGALFAVLGTAYYLLAPLPTDLLGIRDGEASRTFGQEQLAEAVTRAMAEHGAELIALPGYANASRLAFALGTDRDVIAIEGRIDQLQLWRSGEADAGKDAIIVVPRSASPDRFAGLFSTVEDLGQVETTRFGRRLETYQLLLGRGFGR